jgi:hypothetical protein
MNLSTNKIRGHMETVPMKYTDLLIFSKKKE